MKTINVYTFSELPENAQSSVISKNKCLRECETSPWNTEIYDSMHALLRLIPGLDRRKYRYTFEDSNVGKLTGVRGYTWLLNNVLSRLEISRTEWIKNRKDYLRYGADYRMGKVKPCPFTGVCYDNDFLESLTNDVLSGCSLEDAVNNLPAIAISLEDLDRKDYCSEESIREYLYSDGTYYTIDGKEV